MIDYKWLKYKMMDFQEKIEELRKIIKDNIEPLITSDYVHLDNPYHGNIGDILIWEGERQFLSSIKYKCLQSSSNSWCENYLHPETVILFHGGGNFGDLYRECQDFRLRVIEQFPNNRIIMFPQSIWYEDESLIAKDAAVMARHNDLTLCARDKWSYNFLKEHFGKNKILLVPDMAFYISDEYLNKYREAVFGGQKLYLRRIDKEMDFSTILDDLRGFDIRDWPSLERRPICLLILRIMKRAAYYLQKITCLTVLQRFVNHLADEYAIRIVRPYLLKRGCDFISPYSEVITTRLHGLILSILFHKPVYYINNTTGKLSAYVDTWHLQDILEVSPYVDKILEKHVD